MIKNYLFEHEFLKNAPWLDECKLIQWKTVSTRYISAVNSGVWHSAHSRYRPIRPGFFQSFLLGVEFEWYRAETAEPGPSKDVYQCGLLRPLQWHTGPPAAAWIARGVFRNTPAHSSPKASCDWVWGLDVQGSTAAPPSLPDSLRVSALVF